MAPRNFDGTVAARTRAAAQIRTSPELKAGFTAVGGVEADLLAVERSGLDAEAANQTQGATQRDGKTATLEAVTAFTFLQREYVLFLAALRATQGQLLLADAKDAVAAKLADIIANRATVTLVEGDAQEDGKKKRTAARSEAQEAVRAEIERDAKDALELSAVSGTLTARGWTATRITKLRDDARALAGKLGVRAAKKGAAKSATQAERTAVARQSTAWAAIYPLLAILGRRDARVAALLAETT